MTITQTPSNTQLHRTRNIEIVLISGKLQHGKSTTAGYLRDVMDKYPNIGFGRASLANPLKEIAYNQFGWDGNKDEKGRRLLQEIGDAGRDYDENIWVGKLENQLSEVVTSKFVFIDDWRYPNERNYFQSNFLYNVTTIRIERNADFSIGDTGKHRSENSLPVATTENLEYDKNGAYNFVVHNFGTMQDLYTKLDRISDYLKTRIIPYKEA